MENQEIAQKFVLLQKTIFDTCYDTMIIAQDHTENVSNILLNHSPWFPEKGKQVIADYSQNLKKNRDDFKKIIDNHFNVPI